MEDGIEDDRGRASGERLPPRGHLVEHQPEREQIRAGVQVVAARLLGRHVGNRAERDARAGAQVFALRRHEGWLCVDHVRRTADLGEAEVENFRVAAPGHEDVRRLDVAVHDALDVGGVERVRDLRAEVDDLLHRKRPAVNQVLERLPLESSSITMKCWPPASTAWPMS